MCLFMPITILDAVYLRIVETRYDSVQIVLFTHQK